MRAEVECVKEEFQLEIHLLAEEGRFWQICTCEPCLWLSKEHNVTELCSCPVNFFKRTDSDNYKNTAAALFSQKSEILLPHLLFVHIYKYMHLIYMCLSVYTNIHYIFFFVVLLVYFLPFLWVSANFQACASNSKGKLRTFSF